MADSKADKPTGGHKPAANEPDFSGAKVDESANTTVAREQGDPKDSASNLEGRLPENDPAATGKLGFNHGDFNPVTATDSQLSRADVDTSVQERIDALPNVPVYNVNAGLSPRVGGPYLDNKEMEEAERQRAVFEGREPNFSDMAGSAGVTLMTAGQVAAANGGSPALAHMIADNADNDKLGPTPVTTVPMVGTDLHVIEIAEAEDNARREWDNTKVTSHDNPGVVFTDAVESGNSTKVTANKKK